MVFLGGRLIDVRTPPQRQRRPVLPLPGVLSRHWSLPQSLHFLGIGWKTGEAEIFPFLYVLTVQKKTLINYFAIIREGPYRKGWRSAGFISSAPQPAKQGLSRLACSRGTGALKKQWLWTADSNSVMYLNCRCCYLIDSKIVPSLACGSIFLLDPEYSWRDLNLQECLCFLLRQNVPGALGHFLSYWIRHVSKRCCWVLVGCSITGNKGEGMLIASGLVIVFRLFQGSG